MWVSVNSLGAAAVLVSACALGISNAASQEAVFVVRHAEQIETGEDPPLSALGHARAERLARTLRDAKIRAIYTTDTQRTQETAQPLAEAAKLKPIVVARSELDQLPELIRRQDPHSRILVIGHSDSIPTLLRALGSGEEVRIAPREHDNIFVVLPRPEGGSPLSFRLHY